MLASQKKIVSETRKISVQVERSIEIREGHEKVVYLNLSNKCQSF